MGRFALGLLVAVLWLSATPSAEACIAGSPCLKYQHVERTVDVRPEYFARADGTTIPKFDRKKLAHYLAGARWTPVYADDYGIGRNPYYRVNYRKDTSKLHLIDATAKIPTPGKDERVVIVREIERNSEGDVFVDIDGTAFELWYCVSKRGAAPCLTTTGASFYSMFPLANDGAAATKSDSDLEIPQLKRPF